MLKRLKLKNRMLISICLVALVCFAVTIAYNYYKFSSKAKADALAFSEESAFRYGAVVQARLEVPMDAARTLAQTFEALKMAGKPDRALMDMIQKQILERNPGFLGVWTCWEPNALDGRDKEYINAKGHDETGRYVPYWHRGTGSIALEPLVGYDVPGDGDYYLIARDTGRETILDPYPYAIGGKDVMLTSLVVPIKVNGKVLGVAGVDISLASMLDLIKDIKPFDTGYGYIVSNNATLTAHHKQDIIGKDFIERQRADVQQPIADAIKNGKTYSLFKVSMATGIHSFQVLTPITIGQTSTPWSFIISIPVDDVMADARRTMYTSAGIGMAALLGLILVVFFIATGIADPMNRIIGSLSEATGQVGSASRQVSSASQQLAEGSTEQAASIEQTSASMEEMSSMTRQNATNATEADRLMKAANQIVSQADASMGELTQSMAEISKASDEIGKIIKTIDEIAFQTNLLALNAAVEAARAGEAGAGFAVVADEVRNLAMRAADAAKNTAELIEGTVKKINAGSAIVNDTNEAFVKVTESASKVGELLADISAASVEQAQGIEQVNKAISEMDKVTQQNAANAEQSASASEQMSAQAAQMNQMVAKLVELIEGTRKRMQSSISTTVDADHGRSSRRKKKSPKRAALNQGTEIGPTQAIAFDDDKDF